MAHLYNPVSFVLDRFFASARLRQTTADVTPSAQPNVVRFQKKPRPVQAVRDVNVIEGTER